MGEGPPLSHVPPLQLPAAKPVAPQANSQGEAPRAPSSEATRGFKGALPVAEKVTAEAGQPLAFAQAKRRANA